ncbi:hypothetical protein ETD83_21950 [Actinomadura soli]|uniref:Uncharacterized protein n=1 Tax=Actinomadura soli TaxID=2508997 RepID=A0A5C4J9M4_9ACTN|nr:hypothetical protein [Actinomadura soli]TMQ95905.1 hypothetical protein ETD83_21950 [Actinomadura soli]
MVGVDHTSGTDIKPEPADQPQTPENTSQPPPDRPGSPGQPSRLESRAAARAPAETEGATTERGAEKPDQGKAAAEPEPQDSDEKRNVPQALESREPEGGPGHDDDRATPPGPRAESWARAREASTFNTDDPADARLSEPGGPEAEQGTEPTPSPEVGRGPRAESRTRQTEAENAASADSETPETDAGRLDASGTQDRPDEQGAQTGRWDPPGQEPRAGNEVGTDGAEPLLADNEPGEPGTERQPESEVLDEPGRESTAPEAEDIPDTGRDTEYRPAERDDSQPSPEAEERPDEISDGDNDGNDDRGRNTENQPASPAPEENETDRFAGLPTRADLDPAGAGELTRERGEPLTPINENQDLREPDPEQESDWKKMMRGLNNDVEDALKTGNDLGNDALKLTEHRPPSDYPTGTKDNSPQIRELDNSANIPSAAMGIVAAAMVMYSLVEGFRTAGRRLWRRNDDGNR